MLTEKMKAAKDEVMTNAVNDGAFDVADDDDDEGKIVDVEDDEAEQVCCCR